MQDTIKLVHAKEKDVKLLHRLQTEAFMKLYEKYNDDETSPAKESEEIVFRKITDPHAEFYVIYYKEEPAGGIRIRHHENGNVSDDTSWISPIFIIPAFQNKGIAQQVIREIFIRYPKTTIWKLDTIKQEKGNCYLYEKCGFSKVGTEHVINDKMTLIDYERRMDKERTL